VRGARLNADAHPGNFIVLGDGRLGLLDFGALRTLEPRTVAGLRELLAALRDGRPDLVPALCAVGFELEDGHRRVVRAATNALSPPMRTTSLSSHAKAK
ncbi:MAG: hypothetical protein GY944_24125, partial [bacterium]|nr:hypothetical protein [bacterium]